MTLALYRALTTILAPLINLYLLTRRIVGKEDRERIRERLGHLGAARPPGSLAWIHAASVGEAISALPLVDGILEINPGVDILFTTGTVTSGRLIAERLPRRARHQYVPIDRLKCVRNFLRHWRPDVSLWMESELWPNLITETQESGVPMLLVNGRMSRNSLDRWRRFPRLIEPILQGFSLCLVQSDTDAARYRELGAKNVRSVGNLKAASPPLPCNEEALSTLRDSISDRPMWLAASTHVGEEAAVITAHKSLNADNEGLLTIIVPRHPHRAEEIRRDIVSRQLSVAIRSRGEPVSAETDIYLADTLGELGLFYRLADIVFVGGSLVCHGGQNPLEPARLGCAVLHGPHMHNFASVIVEFARRSATVRVADVENLAATVGALLNDQESCRRLQEAASDTAAAQAGVLDAYMAELTPYLKCLMDKGSPGPDPSAGGDTGVVTKGEVHRARA